MEDREMYRGDKKKEGIERGGWKERVVEDRYGESVIERDRE